MKRRNEPPMPTSRSLVVCHTIRLVRVTFSAHVETYLLRHIVRDGEATAASALLLVFPFFVAAEGEVEESPRPLALDLAPLATTASFASSSFFPGGEGLSGDLTMAPNDGRGDQLQA